MTHDCDDDNDAFDNEDPGDRRPESEFDADSLTFNLDDCTVCYTGSPEIAAYLCEDGQNDPDDELRFRTRHGYFDLVAGEYYSDHPFDDCPISFENGDQDEDLIIEVDPDFE